MRAEKLAWVPPARKVRRPRISAAITQITQRLWGGLLAGDLATAGRVLAIITERANAELAR